MFERAVIVIVEMYLVELVMVISQPSEGMWEHHGHAMGIWQ